MENLSHSRQPNILSKKTCNGASNKFIYDDVFGGPPKSGPQTLSPRIEDYSEIFGAFHASRASSIPVLDVPLLESEAADIFFDVGTSGFDYHEVFGGFNGPDFAVAFEELMMEQSNGHFDSSGDEAWTPEEADNLSEESDHSAMDQCLSNGVSHDSIDGRFKFNISYNKASQRTKEDMSSGVTDTQHHDVSGYTFMVDKKTSLPETDYEYQLMPEINYDHLNMSFGGEILRGRHLKKVMSYPANGSTDELLFGCDRRPCKEFIRNSSLPSETFLTISDVSLKTQPSDLPPPSRPPPALDDQKQDSGKATPTCKSAVSEENDSDCSPPYFDVVVDTNSSAAISAAAMKDATEKAQEKVKSTNESMVRRRDGFQTQANSVSMNERKDNDGKLSKLIKERGQNSYPRDKNGGQDFISEEIQNIKKTTQIVLDSIAEKKHPNVVKASSEENHARESLSSEGSDSFDGAGEWKEATQFFELVTNKSRKVFSHENNKNALVSDPNFHEHGKKEKDSFETTERLQENGKKERAVEADDQPRQYEKKSQLSKEPFECNKISGRSEDANNRKVDKMVLGAQDASRQIGNVMKLENYQLPIDTDKKQGRIDVSLKQENSLEVQQRENIYTIGQDMKLKERGSWTKECSKLKGDSGKLAIEKEDIERTFELDESEMKLNPSLELEEYKRRLKKAFDKQEREEVIKPVHKQKQIGQVQRGVYEKEDKETRLKEALGKEEKGSRLRETNEKEEILRKKSEAVEREENEKREREARENEMRQREALEREESEKKLKEALEKEEKGRRLKETLEKEEMRRKLREAAEQEDSTRREKEENELRRKEAFEEEEKRRKQREAAEREENVKREREQNEKKLKEVHEKQENERRLKVAVEQEENENRQKKTHARENEKKQKEASEKEESRMRFKASEKEEIEQRVKEVAEDRVVGRLEEACVRQERCTTSRGASETTVKTNHNPDEMWVASKDESRCEEKQKPHVGNDESGQEKRVSKLREDYTELTNECKLDKGNNHQTKLFCEHERNSKLESTEEIANEKSSKKITELRNGEKISSYTFQGNLNPEKNWFRAEDFISIEKINEKDKGCSQVELEIKSQEKKFAFKRSERGTNIEQSQVPLNQTNSKGNLSARGVKESVETGKGRVTEGAKQSTLEVNTSTSKVDQPVNASHRTERNVKNSSEALWSENKEAERLKRDTDMEKERLRKIEEEMEREREREKDRMAVDNLTLETRERAIAESRERAERAAVERVTAEARQRALNEARERLEKVCAEAREKTLPDKASAEARFRAERAAVERATAEARERAFEKVMAERSAFGARERLERSASDNFSASSRNSGLRPSSTSSGLQDLQSQGTGSFSRYQYSSVCNERYEGVEGESAQRCKARLERHRRTAERAEKALAEKNMRDLLVQREQAERNRLAETLDADVKRWSSGKEGNLRALLSTLQYILGPDSSWQPIPLTEVITSAAVKKAYRKATLCVHPDKLQQRGASIQQKYICEKVFDLLKEAWTKFNSEER